MELGGHWVLPKQYYSPKKVRNSEIHKNEIIKDTDTQNRNFNREKLEVSKINQHYN